MVSMSISAFATNETSYIIDDGIENLNIYDEKKLDVKKETTFIDGYECYKEHGQYYTYLDGEKCLVIHLDDDIITSNYGDLKTSQQTRSYSEYPPEWPNTFTDDISTGIPAYGRCNISSGDYYSSTFKAAPSTRDATFRIYSPLLLANEYKFKFWIRKQAQGWTYHDVTVVLGANLTRILFTGTASRLIDRAAFMVLKESKGQKIFDYSFYQK